MHENKGVESPLRNPLAGRRDRIDHCQSTSDLTKLKRAVKWNHWHCHFVDNVTLHCVLFNMHGFKMIYNDKLSSDIPSTVSSVASTTSPGGSTFLIHAPIAPLTQISPIRAPLLMYSQEPFVSEETGSHGAFTPKSNSIRKGSYGRSMTYCGCQREMVNSSRKTECLTSDKAPSEEYLVQSIFGRVHIPIPMSTSLTQTNQTSCSTHATCPMLLLIAYNKLLAISSCLNIFFLSLDATPFRNTFPKLDAMVDDLRPIFE